MENLFSIASVGSILSTTFQAQGLPFPGMVAKVNGRLTVLGLVGFGSMISMLILVSNLRSVESKQISMMSYVHVSNEPDMVYIPIRALHTLEEIFPQASPQRPLVT